MYRDSLLGVPIECRSRDNSFTVLRMLSYLDGNKLKSTLNHTNKQDSKSQFQTQIDSTTCMKGVMKDYITHTSAKTEKQLSINGKVVRDTGKLNKLTSVQGSMGPAP